MKDTLPEIQKQIISFINNKGKTSLLLILDKLEKFDDEELLETIFKLVESGLVVKSNSD